MAHVWVPSAPGAPLPALAVVGGHDCDGTPIFVGRSYHEGDNLPAKVVPSKYTAYVCWGGREITKNHYEVLVGNNYCWIPCAAGQVPPNAVLAGNTVTGEPLFIGRGYWEGSLTVGKIHPSHHCLYIPFGGAEHRLDCYEVLTYNMPMPMPPPHQHPQDDSCCCCCCVQ
ncbi:natterin-1-like isoform X2 [Episyrphus balteatus]|uniref:natterin-1-like isoform X2 n=1 Tax=Episyrphus balteatus TaxID=286459 RepID=UPI002484ECAD|nr:natterin-1-like isoform X2 [Episyrphus balteatus]